MVGLGFGDLWIYGLEPLERRVKVQEWPGFLWERKNSWFRVVLSTNGEQCMWIIPQIVIEYQRESEKETKKKKKG